MKIKKISGPITADRDEWFHIWEFTVFQGGFFCFSFTAETAEGQHDMRKVLNFFPVKAQFGYLPCHFEKGQCETSIRPVG